MPYTTQTNLIKSYSRALLIKLTDDYKTGDIVTEHVDWAITRAQNEIDSYVMGRYPADMETDDVPPFITDIATTLTMLHLYDRRLMLTLPESLKNKYKNAIMVLKNIQKGEQSPYDSGDEPVVVKSNKDSDDKVFNSTLWAGYPTI